MQEIFKDIPGYEGRYQVSNKGRVKSFGNDKHRKEKILKPIKTKLGYLIIGFYKNDKYRRFRIHRLVLSTFIGKSSLDCNHKNGIKTDNRLENLEYCTRSENIIHAFKIGLKTQIGEKNSNHKLIEKQVVKIRKLYKTKKYTQRELAKMFNISRRTISDIVRKRSWIHI